MVEKSSKWLVPKLQFKTILRFKRPVSMIFLPYNMSNKTFERISYFDPKLCIGYNCRGILPWGIIPRAHLGAYNAGAMGTYITYISGMLAPLHPAKSRPCPAPPREIDKTRGAKLTADFIDGPLSFCPQIMH